MYTKSDMIDVEGTISNWRELANCRESDPDTFGFGPEELTAEQVVAAKAICKVCDVRADCLSYALATNQREGIWGGMTYDERLAYIASGEHRKTKQ